MIFFPKGLWGSHTIFRITEKVHLQFGTIYVSVLLKYMPLHFTVNLRELYYVISV